jgi:hypothetical protein
MQNSHQEYDHGDREHAGCYGDMLQLDLVLGANLHILVSQVSSAQLAVRSCPA